MSAEFEIYPCFRDLVRLLRSVIEKDRRSVFLESRKTLDYFRKITMFSDLWIFESDKVESIDRHDLITQDVSLRLMYHGGSTFDPEVSLVISIDVEYSFRRCDRIQLIDQMLESPIHSIEQIARYTHDFWIFRIDFFYDSSEKTTPQNMSEMNI